MKSKEYYYKQRQIVKEMIDVIEEGKNKNEKEKYKIVKDTAILYVYYALIVDDTNTRFKKMSRIMQNEIIENEHLYDTYSSCLKGLDILYEALLSDLDDRRRKDYEKLERSFWSKLDETTCLVLKTWKLDE